MAFQRSNFNSYKGSGANYSTSADSQVEDTFISEMLSEFGKFNQDFFIMKMMSKAIDSIGNDPQKFIMFVDMLELALSKSEKLPADYPAEVGAEMTNFELLEGSEPQDDEKALFWNLKRSMTKFAVIFGRMAKQQPIEIVGDLDPQKFKDMEAIKAIRESEKKETEEYPPELKAAYNEYMRLKMNWRNEKAREAEGRTKGQHRPKK